MSAKSFLAAIILSGCAIAPFATDHNALPLGEGGNAVDTGISPAPYVQYARGVASRLDLGVGAEVQIGYSLYGWGKYSFITPAKISDRQHSEGTSFYPYRSGFAVAGIFGGGLGYSILDTTFLFAGPIASYRQRNLEFYLHPRINYLSYEEFDVTDDDKLSGFNVKGGSFTYWQLAGGAQYYFARGLALGLSAAVFPPGPGEPVRLWPGVNVIIRF